MKEHIDYCFTCISKTLPSVDLENYLRFSGSVNFYHPRKTEGLVEHMLNDARDAMTDIFEHRCALINQLQIIFFIKVKMTMLRHNGKF